MRRRLEGRSLMLLTLRGYTVSCALCGNRYELTRGDARPPEKPRRCSMPECCGLVEATPIYLEAK